MNRWLLADRLCYLAEGQEGLTKRHAMQRAYFEDDKFWWDKYDTQALDKMRSEEKQKEANNES